MADPFRWLEDADGAKTLAWMEAEDALTESFLAAVPTREAIRARLQQLWDYPKLGVPFPRGGRWFQWRQRGLEDQPCLYVMDDPVAEGRVLLDVNALSADGTVAVTSASVTDDGALLAYATSGAGSDWRTWRVRDVASGRDTPDVVEWSKFSGAAWRRDGSGFYYGAVDPPAPGTELTAENRFEKVFFHRVGTPQCDDELVFSAPDQPDWTPWASVSEDGRFLVVSVQKGIFPENQVHVADLAHPAPALRPVVGDFSCQARVVANVERTFYLLTDHGAQRRRLVAVDLDAPERDLWREVVAESEDTLLDARLYGGGLVCHYLHDAHSVLRVHGLDGTYRHRIPLPGIASLAGDMADGGGIEGRRDSDVVHFSLTSFVESGSLWSHHLADRTTTCLRPSAAPFDAASCVTEQVFATSADGTPVPMFLTRLRRLAPTGDVPVLLYGYGGFDIPLTPSFSARQAAWVERGGLLGVANLRGGGEYGRAWYDAGRRAHKQNVFDDFCACARWLVDSGWSKPERIAINGGSNGGLLVGACLTQHPELFGAAVAEVGVFDMLRFHKFTIGWAWTSDFGDPDDPEQYRWLRRYSPLHNVHHGERYPATLIMTGDHDDRVVPAHSFKFAAALQAAQGGDQPVLIRIDRSAGHGQGKPTAKLIDAATDMLAFLDATSAVPPVDRGARSGAGGAHDGVGGEAGQHAQYQPAGQ